MSIFDRFKRQPRPQRAKGANYGDWYSILVGSTPASNRKRLTTDSKYADFLQVGYSQNATVRACIDLMAQSVGSVVWLYYKDKSGKGLKALDAAEDLDELDQRHPIVDMLENPNPEQGKPEWLQQYVLHYVLAGNCYLYSALDVKGSTPRKSQLWWLDPDYVEPQARQRAGDPISYEYAPTGASKQMFTSEQVLHIKAGGVVDGKGIAAAVAAAEAINQNNLARLWNSDLLSNSGRPSAIGKWGGAYELTDEQMQDRAQQLAPFFKPENAGKFLFTQFTDIQQFGMTPEQMGYIEGIKESMREICRAFRVPSQLLGDNEASTYSNYQEARKSLYHEVIIPMTETLMANTQRWFRAWEPGLLIMPDVDSIEALQEDANARFDRANAAQFLTINERRLLANYEPLEQGGDVVLVAAGLMPLEQVTMTGWTGDTMPSADDEPDEQTEAEEAADEDEAQGEAPDDGA